MPNNVSGIVLVDSLVAFTNNCGVKSVPEHGYKAHNPTKMQTRTLLEPIFSSQHYSACRIKIIYLVKQCTKK